MQKRQRTKLKTRREKTRTGDYDCNVSEAPVSNNHSYTHINRQEQCTSKLRAFQFASLWTNRICMIKQLTRKWQSMDHIHLFGHFFAIRTGDVRSSTIKTLAPGKWPSEGIDHAILNFIYEAHLNHIILAFPVHSY